MEYIHGHKSPETAKVVWGLGYRNTVRYWVESKTKYGQRFCSQTINPETGKWSPPEYSPYAEIILLVQFEDGYISYKSWGHRFQNSINSAYCLT